MPALVPPEIQMDPQWQAKIEQDIKVTTTYSIHIYLIRIRQKNLNPEPEDTWNRIRIQAVSYYR